MSVEETIIKGKAKHYEDTFIAEELVKRKLEELKGAYENYVLRLLLKSVPVEFC